MSGWNWSHFFDYLIHPLIIYGAWTTIWLTAAAVAIGLVIGLIVAFLLLSNNKILRSIGWFYVWIWRGTPLLVQLVVIYTGLPLVGIKLNVVTCALIGLGMNEAAFMAEVIRAGIASINKGQTEAARGLGMTTPMLMRLIIIPQAFRFIIPAVGNRINGMLKMSSLASVISMEELLRQGQMLTQEKFAVLEIFMVACVYYLLMTTLWGQVQGRIENYYGRGFSEARVSADAR